MRRIFLCGSTMNTERTAAVSLSCGWIMPYSRATVRIGSATIGKVTVEHGRAEHRRAMKRRATTCRIEGRDDHGQRGVPDESGANTLRPCELFRGRKRMTYHLCSLHVRFQVSHARRNPPTHR